MSISAYVGLQGHGKSYGIVEYVIIPCLQQSRTVFTNIPMNDEACQRDFGNTVVYFTIDDIKQNKNWFKEVFTPGAVLIIDELAKLWPAGLKVVNAVPEHVAFLAEHRHMVGENGKSTEIYFVVQDLLKIAVFARNDVETTYRMVKHVNMGMSKRFRVDIYSGPATGPNPPKNKLERQIFGGVYKKEIYQYYKSHTMSETGEAGDETKIDNRNNILKSWSIKAGILLVIFCLVLAIFGFTRVKNNYVNKPSSSSSSSLSSGASSSASSGVTFRESPHKSSPKEIPDEPPFLSKAKKVVVAWSLRTNNATTDYFNIVFGDYSATLTAAQLRHLGYVVVPVTECLFKITGHDYTGYAMCPTRENRKDVMQRLVADAPVAETK